MVPLDGSEPSRVLSQRSEDFVPGDAIAVAGGFAYVASGRSIHRVDVDSGTTEVVVPLRPGSIAGLAADGDALWWSTGELNTPSATEVARLPLAGGPVEILATGIETDERPYRDEVEARRAVTVPGMTSASDLVLSGGGVLVACTEGVLQVRRSSPSVITAPTEATVTALTTDASGTPYFLEVGARTSLRRAVAGGPVEDLGIALDTTGGLVVVGEEVVGVRRGGASGQDRIVAVALGGIQERTLSAGPFVGGAVTAAGRTVVFIGDRRLWTVTG